MALTSPIPLDPPSRLTVPSVLLCPAKLLCMIKSALLAKSVTLVVLTKALIGGVLKTMHRNPVDSVPISPVK